LLKDSLEGAPATAPNPAIHNSSGKVVSAVVPLVLNSTPPAPSEKAVLSKVILSSPKNSLIKILKLVVSVHVSTTSLGSAAPATLYQRPKYTPPPQFADTARSNPGIEAFSIS
jgi:hypothetical protein